MLKLMDLHLINCTLLHLELKEMTLLQYSVINWSFTEAEARHNSSDAARAASKNKTKTSYSVVISELMHALLNPVNITAILCSLHSVKIGGGCILGTVHMCSDADDHISKMQRLMVGTCESFFLRSNRISSRLGRPIRFRIEFSNRIGRIYHASRNTV